MPRALLWKVLHRYGVPPLIVALIITLHEHVVVKFEVDGVVKLLLSTIGVKQGDLGAPKLFTFFIAAVMETWRSEHSYELCIFRTRDDFKMTGRQPTAHGDEFAITDSEYADDTGLPFPSRAVVEEQTPNVIVHFGRWGLEVHSGIKAPDGSTLKESKSEILFCAARPHCYTDPSTFDGADLSDVLLPGGRFMAIVAKFKYLGGFLSRFGNDAIDVDSRVEAAGKAFGALRGCVFSSTHINIVAKKTVYESLILNILLYGAESWSVTEVMLDRLRVFHARCVRSMCRVSRKHTWQHHISTGELEQRLGVDAIDTYLRRRQLRWLGHVARMDHGQRLPRRMLSSWVPHPRPRGAPPMTYGRTIERALLEFDIDRHNWANLAADRVAWRETLRLGHPPGFTAPPPPLPLSLTRPTRAATAKTNRAIDESLRALRAPP